MPASQMESLLRWGIENSASNDDSGSSRPPLRDISKLDPGIIDMILGRPDSVRMKVYDVLYHGDHDTNFFLQEALGVALDENVPEDARLIALDDFEMVRSSSISVPFPGY